MALFCSKKQVKKYLRTPVADLKMTYLFKLFISQVSELLDSAHLMARSF